MKFQLNGSLALYHLLSGLRPICLLLLVGVIRGVQLEQFVARRGNLLCDMPHTVLVGVLSCPSVGAWFLRAHSGGFALWFCWWDFFFLKTPGPLGPFCCHYSLRNFLPHSLDMQGQPPLPPASFGFFVFCASDF